MGQLDILPHDYLKKWQAALIETGVSAKDNIVRFAPSPTGYLHLGNIYSALYTQAAGNALNARILLRIEDIDQTRCRAEFTEQMIADLQWAGFEGEENHRCQSAHMDFYKSHIDILADAGLLYPCFCTRKDIKAQQDALKREGHDIEYGPLGTLYTGTCRHLTATQVEKRKREGQEFSLRLNLEKAEHWLKENKGLRLSDLKWYDLQKAWQSGGADMFGDFIIARKDTGASYHACVVLDDAMQGIKLVTRGIDLFYATHIHVLLQALWGVPTPLYDHHSLLLSGDHKAFSKSARSTPARELQENFTREELWNALNSSTICDDPFAKM